MWLWPWMVAGTVPAAPVDRSGGASTPQPKPGQAPQAEATREEADTLTCLTAETGQTSRSALMHVTTTLSRTWDQLSHFFARMRDAMAYERLMHASFGWALSPLQRLMPSATWPAVHLQTSHWAQPASRSGAAPGGDAFALATAWWRGFAAPFAPTPSNARSQGPQANPAALAFAPMFGAAAMIPAMGFGFFF